MGCYFGRRQRRVRQKVGRSSNVVGLFRKPILVAMIGVAVVVVVVFAVVAVVTAPGGGPGCAGIKFRSTVDASGSGSTGPRPPIGQGALIARLRSALRGDEQVAYCHDFADPFVLQVDGKYFAYSTNSGKFHVPVLLANRPFSSGTRAEALPHLPGWSKHIPGRVWAPSVLPRNGGYVLYYSDAVGDGRECISVATANAPAGPFTDRTDQPLICPSPRGAIDPSPFVAADGQAYLLWKDGGADAIVVQRLTPDGLHLTGDTHVLIGADQTWEAGIVEGPTLAFLDGRYYLFYSANRWDTPNYAIGYATCQTPTGPCIKPLTRPWLASSTIAQGPGGPEVFRDPQGHVFLALHAWLAGAVGYPQGARNLFVLQLTVIHGKPSAL